MSTLITLTPLGRASFRWYGTSSPMLRGPMTAMVSEALPLPTTVAGALNWVFGGGPREGMGLCELHKSLMAVLGCGEYDTIRGPYVLVHRPRRPADWVAVCLHDMGGFLLCLSSSGEAFAIGKDRVQAQAVGIAVDRERKAVVEGMIYTQTTTDYRAVARVVGEALGIKDLEASVAIETGCGVRKKPVRDIVRLGGEGFLARVSVSTITGKTPLSGVAGGDYAYVATPLLLNDDIIEAGRTDPLNLIERVAEALGVSGPDPQNSRVLIGLAPTGYDVAGRRPRPTYPAIMPGTYVRGSSICVPAPQWLGYGTIVALPREAIDELRR